MRKDRNKLKNALISQNSEQELKKESKTKKTDAHASLLSHGSKADLLKYIQELELQLTKLKTNNCPTKLDSENADTLAENQISEQYLFKLLMDNLPDHIYFKDKESRFIRMNKAQAKRFGLADPEDAIGKTDFDFFTEEHARQAFDDEQEIIRSGITILNLEEKETWKDGSISWVSTTKTPIIDGEGKINGTMGVSRIITDRKLAESLLRETQFKYKIIADNTYDWEFWLSPDNKFLYNSPSCERITGYPAIDFINDPEKLYAIIHPEDRSSFYRHLHEEKTNKEVSAIEFRIITSNSTIKWIGNVSLPVFGQNSEYLGIRGSNRNITDRKLALENLVKANQELSELNSTKDKLFSIIAHDLKSPFNSILGFSSLLVKNFGKYDAAKSEKFIKEIHSSAKSSFVLLENLLTWAKAQTGQMEFKPESVNLLPIIKEIIELSNSSASIKNIIINLDAVNEIKVYADQNLLKTILRNLISNAIKFTNPGGIIRISVDEKPNELLVSVSDTGVGISKANCEKLFKIDQTWSTTGTNNERGTGLGLILCNEFVKKHNGRIWVESEEGKGSIFKFTLPIKA